MKRSILVMLSLILTSFSCIDQEQETSLESLEALEAEINALSESVPCSNAAEWKFTPMGSKACGGPIRYIAYHVSVENQFLDLVNEYTSRQEAFNKKYDVISDCSLLVAPKGVTCEGGKPILVN